MSQKKKALFTVITLLLFFALIELGLRAFDFINKTKENPRLQFAIYKNQPWIRQVYEEYAPVNIKFSRYVHYQAVPVSGEYVNAGSDGLRATWNPTKFAASKPKQIFIFGGSTVFGWVDTRDDYTIPSQVSKLINQAEPKYLVSNYAQPAYNSNQALIKLIFLLKGGLRPGHVVFYGGYNDVIGSYEGNDPDAFISEGWIKEKLEASNLKLTSFIFKNLIRDNCRTCVALTTLIRKSSPGFGRVAEIKGFNLDDSKLTLLAVGIKNNYLNLLSVLDKLSSAYNFKYSVIWQPSLFLEKDTIGEEEKLRVLDWRMEDQSLTRLYKYTNQEVETVKSKNFFDFSKILHNRKEQLYLDSAHVTESGNAIVASEIANIINSGKSR